jgi:tetraacyldisaccharide 4'-kinase
MKLLSLFFGILVALRNKFYDWGVFKVRRIKRPVIAVGNLSVGGTGKTPAIESLLNWIISEGYKPGVVAKGYGGNFSGVKRVTFSNERIVKEFFGDEPEFLAQKYPNVPVYVGKNKSLAAQQLIANEAVDIVLVDDGFQHRALHRNLDLLIVDPFAKRDEWWLLPFGRLREPVQNANRAQVLIISRANLVSKSNWVKSLKDVVSQFKISKKTVVESATLLDKIFSAENPKQDVDLKKVTALLSGIGRPESFELLAQQSGVVYTKHYKFKDHYHFTSQDLENVLSEVKTGLILMTEKDFVKIKSLNVNLKRFAVCSVKSEWQGDSQQLKDQVMELLR